MGACQDRENLVQKRSTHLVQVFLAHPYSCSGPLCLLLGSMEFRGHDLHHATHELLSLKGQHCSLVTRKDIELKCCCTRTQPSLDFMYGLATCSKMSHRDVTISCKCITQLAYTSTSAQPSSHQLAFANSHDRGFDQSPCVLHRYLTGTEPAYC